MRARATRAAVLATLTIEAGADDRSERQQRLGEAHHRVEVELHVAAHVVVAALGEAAPPRGAGVVDEQVEPPMLLLDVGAHPLGGPGLGQVDGDVGGPAGQRLGERAQPLLATGDEDQLGAGLAGQPPRGRLADPTRSAGDHR